MDQTKKNKEFIISYFNALGGVPKTRESMAPFMDDPDLVEHILFFESVFPCYEVFADEMMAESNKVFVRARFRGRHQGDFNGIPPTFKLVEFPFAIGYEIENEKITHHWLIADQATLMEQLGLTGVSA
ncbi:MAG TPA: ester cyclase [Puia sp.]|nr:ester cyclase [Puia sp.]